MPSATSRLLTVAGLMRPWNLVRRATSGPPGSSRGRMKLSVTAAQRVTRKNSSRRIRYRISYILSPSKGRRARPAVLLGRIARLFLVHPEHDLFPVGNVPGCWRRVRVILRRPAGEHLGVVLIPGDALGDRDHGDLFEHDALDLLHDLVLLGAVGCGRELLDQLVGDGVVESAIVARRGLAEGRGRLTVERVAELVEGVRPRRRG